MVDNSSKYYDIEAIKSFVDKVNANCDKAYNNMIQAKIQGTEPPIDNLTTDLSRTEMLAAVRALAAVIYAGADLKKELGIRKKKAKKRKGSKLDETIHSEEFGVVMAYAAGDITYTEASAEIMELTGVELRAAQDFIAKRKPAAVNVVKIRELIDLKIKEQK